MGQLNAVVETRPPHSPPGHRYSGHLPTDAKQLSVLVFCAIGLLGGAFGGLLGIGGGSAIAPLLLILTRLRPSRVAGTTLGTVFVVSAVGSIAYLSLGHLNLNLAWPIAIGSVTGAVLGALTSRRLSVRLMLVVFLLVLPYYVVKEFWPALSAPVVATNLISLGMLGLATGYLGGLLGISGASLLVPSLVGFFLIDHHAAQGIALAVALSDSAAGVAAHSRARSVDYRVLFYLAAPAFVGALGGALLSHYLSASVLRNIFGAFLAMVWTTVLARFIKDFLPRSRPSSALPSPSTEGEDAERVRGVK